VNHLISGFQLEKTFRLYKIKIFKVQYTLFKWGYSSAGRAPALQAGGPRFDPA
jgi:hypothetical protein